MIPLTWFTITYLKLVFMLLVYLRQKLGFASVQGFNQGIALRHQTGLEFHAVFLRGGKTPERELR